MLADLFLSYVLLFPKHLHLLVTSQEDHVSLFIVDRCTKTSLTICAHKMDNMIVAV